MSSFVQARITICLGPCAVLKNATASDTHSHPMRKAQTPKKRPAARRVGFAQKSKSGSGGAARQGHFASWFANDLDSALAIIGDGHFVRARSAKPEVLHPI